ncbi:MAG TPA: alpha/beta fold hydrolase [Longimicrobiaceae bacterium]|nr:alpha/beta fold hydrolase [Longimicrobiaceae bacterium]
MEAVVGGVTLYYRLHGEGEPVLFVHGFPLSGEMWMPAVERLGGGFRCIVPDLRGHGASGVTAEASMEQYAEDLAGVLDAAGERRPVVLVGMSMGGYIAFEFLRRFPERARALALVDTRAQPDTEEGARVRYETAGRALREGSRVVAEGMVGKLFAPGAPEELRARWLGIMSATPPEGAAAALRAMARRPDSRDTLRGFVGPVLVVVGEEDAITPVEEARGMAEVAPGGRVEVVPGAGHMAPVEQPDTVAAVLCRFLREIA